MDAMQHLKDQLEQRTRMIEANIQRQQDELRQIQEELQRVQGQNLQVREHPLVSRRRRAWMCIEILSVWMIIEREVIVQKCLNFLCQSGYIIDIILKTESS